MKMKKKTYKGGEKRRRRIQKSINKKEKYKGQVRITKKRGK